MNFKPTKWKVLISIVAPYISIFIYLMVLPAADTGNSKLFKAILVLILMFISEYTIIWVSVAIFIYIIWSLLEKKRKK